MGKLLSLAGFSVTPSDVRDRAMNKIRSTLDILQPSTLGTVLEAELRRVSDCRLPRYGKGGTQFASSQY